MKIQLPWRSRTKSINFDEDYGRRLLEYTRQDPAVAESLEGSLELRGSVHAIIAALPGDIELDYNMYLDIASVLIFQRAQGYEEARMDSQPPVRWTEADFSPEVHGELDSETEETTEE